MYENTIQRYYRVNFLRSHACSTSLLRFGLNANCFCCRPLGVLVFHLSLFPFSCALILCVLVLFVFLNSFTFTQLQPSSWVDRNLIPRSLPGTKCDTFAWEVYFFSVRNIKTSLPTIHLQIWTNLFDFYPLLPALHCSGSELGYKPLQICLLTNRQDPNSACCCVIPESLLQETHL